MSDIFYLRPITPPISPGNVPGMAKDAAACLDLYHVDWKHSFLSADGGRMLCWYQAPDAESARVALRQAGSNMNAVWAGTVMGDGAESPPVSTAGLLAEVAFETPLATDDLASRVANLDRQGVPLVRGFLSTSGTRWLGALGTRDEQSARRALENVGLRVEALWACTPITPKQPA